MSNQLKNESSLYLKQHKDNPVDWLPWSKHAFEKSKKEQKPIFLSIGYSACHWCHVMAHECFEDEDIAKLMNDNFINIKVDKEERPDIDQIYQTAHYIFSRRPGGWPLSVFITPDQEPFYIGTYFPKIPKHNLPAFPQIIERLSKFFKEEKGALGKQTLQLKEIINSMKPDKSELINITLEDIENTVSTLFKNYDSTNGGLGNAPKFPNEPSMRFLIENSSSQAQEIIKLSLEKILHRGLFDHLEGGFFRYCVDVNWSIPHYEKMLYNTAQLLELFALWYQSKKNEKVKEALDLSVGWLTSEMQSKKGGFYSSIDADSKNIKGVLEEGAYYNWSLKELKECLTSNEFYELSDWFDLSGEPNFEGVLWHLNLKSFDGISECKNIREKLSCLRKKRTKPSTDKKVITSWNALFIKSLLVAGKIFNKPEWINLAQDTLDFIYNNLFEDRKLKSIYVNEKALLNGYLDDYAFLLDGLIQSMQSNYRECDLLFAIQIGDILKENFQSKDGAFYFTEHEHEVLFDRQMIAEDNAMPSGNGVACFALQKLSQVTFDNSYLESAERAMHHWNNRVKDNPQSYPSLLRAYTYYLKNKSIVYIRGTNEELNKWQKQISNNIDNNNNIIIYLKEGEKTQLLTNDRPYRNGGVAYLCNNHACLPAIYSVKELIKILR